MTNYDTIARIQVSERDNSRYENRQENGRDEFEDDLGTPMPFWPVVLIFMFGLSWGVALTLGVQFFTSH